MAKALTYKENFPSMTTYDYLPLNERLEWAIYDGNIKAIAQLLALGEDVNNPSATMYGSPLEAALIVGCHQDIIQLLIEKGANVHGTANEYASYLAVAFFGNCSIETIELLLAQGLVVDLECVTATFPKHNLAGLTFILNHTTLDPSPLLHHVAAHGFLEGLKLLLEKGANIHTQNAMGQTALHIATDPAIQRFLLEQGANPLIMDNQGNSFYHTSILYGEDLRAAIPDQLMNDQGWNLLKSHLLQGHYAYSSQLYRQGFSLTPNLYEDLKDGFLWGIEKSIEGQKYAAIRALFAYTLFTPQAIRSLEDHWSCSATPLPYLQEQLPSLLNHYIAQEMHAWNVEHEAEIDAYIALFGRIARLINQDFMHQLLQLEGVTPVFYDAPIRAYRGVATYGDEAWIQSQFQYGHRTITSHSALLPFNVHEEGSSTGHFGATYLSLAFSAAVEFSIGWNAVESATPYTSYVFDIQVPKGIFKLCDLSPDILELVVDEIPPQWIQAIYRLSQDHKTIEKTWVNPYAPPGEAILPVFYTEGTTICMESTSRCHPSACLEYQSLCKDQYMELNEILHLERAIQCSPSLTDA